MGESEEQPTQEEIAEFEELQRQFNENYYTTIGKGISAWSRNEGLLVTVGAILLRTTFEKAGLVFYSIINFHAWLSIIDELFENDPQYQDQRPQWLAIAKQLRKLNDTRVRLAHQEVHAGKGFLEAVAAGEEEEVLYPSLKPNQFDTRAKSKKHSSLQFEDLVNFISALGDVATDLAELSQRMAEIYLKPKRALVQKLRDRLGRDYVAGG
ncbi:hypothetical protein [Bradyrhizobium sp. USDA 3315]